MRTHQVSAEIARRKATFVCSLLQRPFMTAERGQQASCPLVSCSCSCRAYAPARAPGPARSDLRSASTLSTLQRVALYSSRFAFSFGVRRSAFDVQRLLLKEATDRIRVGAENLRATPSTLVSLYTPCFRSAFLSPFLAL